ncbi:MAG TPA: carbohydrate-binding protein [Polyangia bacterium]|jgi:BNR/Asp-box repeat.|nr:carbohydrate-binding protein [Polyangia bacterium]
MIRCPMSVVKLAGALLPFLFMTASCVDTGQSATAGGIGGQSQGTGGVVGTDDGIGGCPGETDTATDGTAGTTGTGPYLWKSVTMRGGGFVDGIIYSSVEKDLTYARTDMGGAYRWDAPMNGWVPITDWISRANWNWIGIESIAADPVDANVVYMAAGTYMGSGNGVILRSTDRGATFKVNAIGVPMGGNADGRSMGERLAIDPNLTSKLYFASRANGLMVSTDSGTTWSRVASFPVTGGTTYGGTSSNGTPYPGTGLGLSFVLFDPKSATIGSGSSTIYVGVADITAGSNLFVSKDSGLTWALVAGGPSQWMPHHAAFDSIGNLYLAYNYGVVNKTVSYPVGGPNGFTTGGIWKFDPVAAAWADITPNKNGKFGYGGVTVDPNTGTIIAATLDWWNPDEIYRSTDGGTNWLPIGRKAQHNLNGAQWLRWGAASCGTSNPTGWVGDIEIDPFDSDHVMYVTGQGVWSSNNATAAAPGDIVWTFNNRNLEQTAVTDMVPSVNGAFLSCVGDIGGMRNENLDQPSSIGMYSNPVFGSCSSLDVAGQNAAVVVRAGSASNSNPGKIGGYSTDNGKTWSPFATLPAGAVTTGSGGRLAVSADGSTVLWGLSCIIAPATTASTVFHVSSDMGANWKVVTGLPGNSSIAADRVNSSKFYGYSYTNNVGTVYVSNDSGMTFTAATPNSTAFPGRGTLRVSFGHEGDVWLVPGSNAALYHSTESGANLAALGNVQAAYAVGFGKAADGSAFPSVFLLGAVGGVTGIFRSDDQGANWTPITDDQHQFGVAGYVSGDEKVSGRVYVGSNGRGVIYGDPLN